MKKSKIVGWQSIFNFTFFQTIKDKSTKTMLLILCLGALISLPIYTFINNYMNNDNRISNISTVYIKDETSFKGTDYSKIKVENQNYSEVKFTNTDKTVDELTDLILKDEEKSIILHITKDDMSYQMQFIKNPNGKIKDKDFDNLTDNFKEYFEEIRLLNLQITDEQYDMAYSEIKTNVYISGVDGESLDKTSKFSSRDARIIYMMTMFSFFVFMTSSSMVATSIVTEKSSRIIETLMISVRPLSIIVGKVLAMFCVTFLQFGLVFLSLLLSNILSIIVFKGNSNINIINVIIDSISNVHIGRIILMVVIFLCGFLFYSLYAALFGSTVSRIDDLQEGLTIYSITIIVGFYLSYFLINANIGGLDVGAFTYVIYLLPFSSPFVVPVYLLLNKIPIWIGLVSLLIQIISLIFIALFVSKVYETLILHNGSRVKAKDLFKMFKHS